MTAMLRLSLLLVLFAARYATVSADPYELLLTNVISREVSVFIGAEPDPPYRQVISREISVFIGAEPTPPYKEVFSREVSLVVTTPEAPARVTQLTVNATPTGETTTLSWSGYNQWAEKDVARYDIYMSTKGFTDISTMTPHASVPADTLGITLTNLPAWQDRCFAVVAVDAAKNADPTVQYAAAYTIAKETVSREVSVFVGAEPTPPYKEVVSREVSLVVTTPEAPARITQLTVNATPTGETTTLSWAGYNQWAEKDVARYDIYMATRGFTDISTMTPYASVPGETLGITLSGLPAWQDHCFAVVPVDAAGNANSNAQYAAAYIIAREVISREVGVFVGGETDPPYREVVSREVSLVVGTSDIPAPVTGVDSGFGGLPSTVAYASLDLDWPDYNELAQADVVRYRIYAGPVYFDSLTNMEPIAYAPAETGHYTLRGVRPEGVYYVAVVAEDAMGQWNPVVYARSMQASIGKLGEVLRLRTEPDTNSLYFAWEAPASAEVFLASYRLYLAGTTNPVVLPLGTTNYTFTDLRSNWGYPLRVTTVDKFGTESVGATLLARTLRVMEPGRIDLAPHDLAIITGENGYLYSVGGGEPPLAYYWRKDGVVLTEAIGPVLALTNATATQSGVYTLQVSNVFGNAVSDPVTVRVVDVPALFSAPQDTVVSLGGTLKLVVGATGTEPITFQWRHNGMPIPSATNAVLVISSVTLSDGGAYTAVVSNPWGVVETTPVLVTIREVGPLYLSDTYEQRPLYTTPQQLGWTNNLNAGIQTGEPLHAGKVGGKSLWMSWVASEHGVATFRTTGSSFDTLLAVYMAGSWEGIGSRKVASDEDQGGYLTSEVAFTAETGREYAIAVDGYAGAAGTVVLGWEFEATTEALPVIAAQSPSQVVLQGTPVTLEVQATGSELTYQWQRNGQNLAGANASQLSLGPASADVAGTYTVRVTNGAGLRVLSQDMLLEVALNAAALGPVSRDKWPDLFLPQGARLQAMGGGGYVALALGQAGARDQSASSALGEDNEASVCEAMGGTARWLWLRPEADGYLKLDATGSDVRDDFGNALSVLLGVYQYHPGEGVVERVCDAEGTGVVLEVSRGEDLLVQMNTVGGSGTVRLNWNLAAAAGAWSGWGVRDGRFWVVEPVERGRWQLDAGDDLHRWDAILQTNVQSGIFQFSEPFSQRIPTRNLRLIGPVAR